MKAIQTHHRDINHGFASKLGGKPGNIALAAPHPEHADEARFSAS